MAPREAAVRDCFLRTAVCAPHPLGGAARSQVDVMSSTFSKVYRTRHPRGDFRWRPLSRRALLQSAMAFTPGVMPQPAGSLALMRLSVLKLLGTSYRRGESETHGILPVIVWIHGFRPNLHDGANSDEAGSYTRAISPGIAVTINYRLNIFAFSRMKATTEIPASGLATTRLWIISSAQVGTQEYCHFVGILDHITISVESVGPRTCPAPSPHRPVAGLFPRAIAESGPCQWQYYPQQQTRTASEARRRNDRHLKSAAPDL